MKPVTLTLSGLHSYRDTVRIDFDHLGEHGVFGIFGPIGSGKSTILDAITLALYGVVDRNDGRARRGIVNHHSARIEVRLRFSLSPGGEPEIWEVQRVYRRNKQGSAVRVNSRLSRIVADVGGETAEVVADKERAVNAAVEDLLGLNATDFMRAVVLPQGRFMRFLHLKGVDRRQMLQRIFRLSAYGEGLRKQIRRLDASAPVNCDRCGAVLANAGLLERHRGTDACRARGCRSRGRCGFGGRRHARILRYGRGDANICARR